MPKFIEIHNNIINIKSISKVEFLSDDIYLGLIPTGGNKEPIVDFVAFAFGKITLFTGEEIYLEIDLYWLEEGQTAEDWAKANRAYINLGWYKLIDVLGEVIKITGHEYES